MRHVFISYSTKHTDLTIQLAQFLEQHGLIVWWDRELVARGPFAPQIHEKLRNAGAVVVLWTEGAIKSEWVRREAEYALQTDMLVNVLAEGVPQESLPPPFNSHERHRPTDFDLILRDVLAVRAGRLLWEEKAVALPQSSQLTPALLLQARYAIVPYVDATGERQRLVDWLLKRQEGVSGEKQHGGRLIHGAGGTGKTRLLIDVVSQVSQLGWTAGFVARLDDSADPDAIRRQENALTHLISGATDAGLLLIVDYAENRQDDVLHLARAIVNAEAQPDRPIRLVLLSRTAGDWWENLVNENDEIQRLFSTPKFGIDAVALPAFNAPQDRLDYFVETVRSFAPLTNQMGYLIPQGQPALKRLEAVERGDGYERPLALQMEALVYLMNAVGKESEVGLAPLLAFIVGAERSHWRKLLGTMEPVDGRNPLLEMTRAVSQITCVQGVANRSEGERLLLADPFFLQRSGASIRSVLDNVSKVYGRDQGIAYLEPDLVGEHFVASAADQKLVDGCLEWAGTREPKDASRATRNILTVLNRASSRDHGPKISGNAASFIDRVVDDRFSTLTKDIVATAYSGPGRLIQQLLLKYEEGTTDEVVAAIRNEYFELMAFARLSIEYNRIIKSAPEAVEQWPDRVGAYSDRLATFIDLHVELMQSPNSMASRSEAMPIDQDMILPLPESFVAESPTHRRLAWIISERWREMTATFVRRPAPDTKRAIVLMGAAVKMCEPIVSDLRALALPAMIIDHFQIANACRNLGRYDDSSEHVGKLYELLDSAIAGDEADMCINVASRLENSIALSPDAPEFSLAKFTGVAAALRSSSKIEIDTFFQSYFIALLTPIRGNASLKRPEKVAELEDLIGVCRIWHRGNTERSAAFLSGALIELGEFLGASDSSRAVSLLREGCALLEDAPLSGRKDLRPALAQAFMKLVGVTADTPDHANLCLESIARVEGIAEENAGFSLSDSAKIILQTTRCNALVWLDRFDEAFEVGSQIMKELDPLIEAEADIPLNVVRDALACFGGRLWKADHQSAAVVAFRMSNCVNDAASKKEPVNVVKARLEELQAAETAQGADAAHAAQIDRVRQVMTLYFGVDEVAADLATAEKFGPMHVKMQRYIAAMIRKTILQVFVPNLNEAAAAGLLLQNGGCRVLSLLVHLTDTIDGFVASFQDTAVRVAVDFTQGLSEGDAAAAT